MKVSLPDEKRLKTIETIKDFVNNKKRTIRNVAKLVGTLNASSPAMVHHEQNQWSMGRLNTNNKTPDKPSLAGPGVLAQDLEDL